MGQPFLPQMTLPCLSRPPDSFIYPPHFLQLPNPIFFLMICRLVPLSPLANSVTTTVLHYLLNLMSASLRTTKLLLLEGKTIMGFGLSPFKLLLYNTRQMVYLGLTVQNVNLPNITMQALKAHPCLLFFGLYTKVTLSAFLAYQPSSSSNIFPRH